MTKTRHSPFCMSSKCHQHSFMPWEQECWYFHGRQATRLLAHGFLGRLAFVPLPFKRPESFSSKPRASDLCQRFLADLLIMGSTWAELFSVFVFLEPASRGGREEPRAAGGEDKRWQSGFREEGLVFFQELVPRRWDVPWEGTAATRRPDPQAGACVCLSPNFLHLLAIIRRRDCCTGLVERLLKFKGLEVLLNLNQ